MLEYIFADRQYLIRRPPTYNPEEKKQILRLVNQAKGGDQDAMSRLIEKSEQMVYTNCLHLLKNPEEARDMAQEVYLTVFLKLDTLKKPEAFFEWVKVIKINKCKNKLKQGNPYFLLEDSNGPAVSPFEEKDDGDPYAHIEDKRDQISPDKTLDTRETQELLINLIDDLPDAQRMVLILFYYDDYSIKQIAQIMEISEGTVKSRLAYGRLALRKALEKEKKKSTVLYGRVPVSLLAYIAHFLKKSFSDHQDESVLLSIREAVLATLWATAWGKAAITTIASAALIGSVAGGISLAAKTKQPEPIPVESREILQEENLEESTESGEEQSRDALADTSQEEAIEASASAQATQTSEAAIVETNESAERMVETEQTTGVEESTSVPESVQTNVNEEIITQLEQDLAQQQENMTGIQANYDNALASYEDALSFAEQSLSEAKLICERELNTWTESYNNLLLSYEGRELDDAGKQDVALHEEQIARWQGNYDIVMPATIEDVRSQIFPADFDNVNVAGADLVEKEQEFLYWEDLRNEQQTRVDEAQNALDMAKQ